MKKFFALLLAPFVLSASIMEIHSMIEIEPYFDGPVQEILGVFDIDYTLLLPVDPAFQHINQRKHQDVLNSIKGRHLERVPEIGNYMLCVVPSQIIHPSTLEVVHRLQEKGIKLIALTAAMTKKFGEHHLPFIRNAELKKNGFDFSTSFPHLHFHVFEDFDPYYESHPMFYRGVICSNGEYGRYSVPAGKGQVLSQFFKIADFNPKKVIFVDDKLCHLVEMEETLKLSHPEITFYGFHYKGALNFESPPIDEDQFQNRWEDLFVEMQLILDQDG